MKAPTEMTVDDVRICYLNDFNYALEEAEAVYDEVFFKRTDGSYEISLYGLAKVLKGIARNPEINLAPCNRGVIMNASLLIAQQAGWDPNKPSKEGGTK